MKSKNQLKLILIFIIAILVSNFTFGASVVQATWNSLNNVLALFVNFISAIWYIFPILAGKLLGNNLIYGNFLHMDVILWKIWNFSKNIANFTIGFLFIFYLFKYIVSLNEKNTSIIKNILSKIVVGALVINLSWFIIAALVDISTVLIAAVGSFSSSVGTNFFKNSRNQKLAITTEINISGCSSGDTNCINFGGISIKENTSKQKAVPLSDILKYEANISGPLMFMGMSILDINNVVKSSKDTAYNNNTNQYYSKGVTMKLLVRLIVMILFFVPMIILIIVLIIRIFWLRIYIGFSPLIFLDQIFGGKVLGKKASFRFSNIIGLIFQPVLVILAFSLSFLLLLAVFVSVNTQVEDKVVNTEKLNKLLGIKQDTPGIISTQYFEIQDSTQLMSKYIGGFFGYMILVFLASSIVWGLLKLALKSSEITTGIADQTFEFTENLLKTTPFIPTPWGKQSIGSLSTAAQKIASYPGRKSASQYDRLMEVLNFKGDMPAETAEEYLNIINEITPYSSLKEYQKDKIGQLFNQIVKYSENITSFRNNKNLRKVIEKLMEKIEAYDNYLDNDLIKELKFKSGKDKVNYFIEHLEEFKEILLADKNTGEQLK